MLRDWEIEAGEFGKPRFADHPDIHFSVSHTPGAIVLVMSDRPVGVDIEHPRPIDERLVAHLFTTDEQRHLNLADDRERAFLEVWTKKEAIVKRSGEGARRPFGSFSALAEPVDTFWRDGYCVSVAA